MSEIKEIVDSLEGKLKRLIGKIEKLELNIQVLKEKLQKSEETIHHQHGTLEVLQRQYESLKVASSLAGSDEYKRETKLKINSLIREIDHCITQLSD
jgi:FtsZ-binding cell division protein ZapB